MNENDVVCFCNCLRMKLYEVSLNTYCLSSARPIITLLSADWADWSMPGNPGLLPGSPSSGKGRDHGEDRASALQRLSGQLGMPGYRRLCN
jgi:hypothetical protein